MALPEYTDGVFELYRIENDESEDYPEEKLRDTGMRFWYRELEDCLCGSVTETGNS